MLLPAALALLAPLQTDPPRSIVVPETGVELELDDTGGRPVVEASIGGEPVRLLVDTGSTVALLLEPRARERLVLSAEGPEARLVPELHLGDARFEDVPWIEMAALPPAWGLDGILGFPCFVGCLVTLDPPARSLRLASGTLPAGPDTLEFRSDETLGFGITIDLDVSGVTVPVHLDTGSPGLVLFSSLLLDELPLAGEPQPVGVARTPMGDAEIREATLQGEVRLGPLVFRDPRVRFGDLPQIAGRRLGNIGSQFLAGARLTIDAESRRLRVELPGYARGTAESNASSATAEVLARFQGSFRIEGRMHASADGAVAPKLLTGRATWAASADGRRRHERFELDGENGPLRGEAFLGPVGDGPALELVQIDAFQPRVLHAAGAWNPADGTIAMERCAEPASPPGASAPALRWRYRFEDGGVIVKELHTRAPDGTLRLASEYRYVPVEGAR
jgi:hypothetical protein